MVVAEKSCLESKVITTWLAFATGVVAGWLGVDEEEEEEAGVERGMSDWVEVLSCTDSGVGPDAIVMRGPLNRSLGLCIIREEKEQERTM